MGYQALLFCPDEKTARTVTQVLSELEFNVETCTEPFAAVKKLMGQHFDAVVVDCDNEQNATLLFKSARNSTSNQASLAVAVVEGQAGVAKAFRIGANLVLTKPINIEQAKGTLRVARGLLRKGEPAKPGVATMASSPAVPVATPSAVPARVELPPAAARSNAAAQDEDLLEISTGNSVSVPSATAPATSAFNKFVAPAPQSAKLLPTSVNSAAPEVKAPANAGSFPMPGAGAASAPAPARERLDARTALASPAASGETRARSETAETEPSGVVGSAPSFTFGGTDAAAESSGAGKKLFVGIAALAILAVAAYAGWAHFHGRSTSSEVDQTETASAPVEIPQSVRQGGGKPSAASSSSKISTSLSSSQTTVPGSKDHASNNADSAFDDLSAPGAKNPSSSASSATGKALDEADDTPGPLVVKGGKTPRVHAKAGSADAPPPSMIGMATAGAGAPPPDLGTGTEISPKPLLQTLNVSQGVSRGLLFKKVQPVYPRNAVAMRVEGSVELLATISKTGDITHVKVLSGDSQLSQAATDAVKQWKYKPYLLNGEPVEIQTQVTINFKLPK